MHREVQETQKHVSYVHKWCKNLKHRAVLNLVMNLLLQNEALVIINFQYLDIKQYQN